MLGVDFEVSDPAGQMRKGGVSRLELFDPFGLQSKMSPEAKEKSLLAEINNGRLAMLGIMAFLAESKVPGSVPALGSVGIKPYAGEVMAPFAAGDATLPYVSDMLKFS